MTGISRHVWVLFRTAWVWIIGWPVALCLLLYLAAASIKALYPDAMARAAYEQMVSSSVATSVFQGRGYELASWGGELAQEMGILTLTIFPLVAAASAIRLTRTAEDRGTLDIITAGQVGRLAPVAAGLLGTIASAAATGGLAAVVLVLTNYPVKGSWLYGLSIALMMAWSGALGLFSGQVFRDGHQAQRYAILVIVLGYLLRGYIDVYDLSATWLTPFSWLAESRAFSTEPPIWPYLAFVGLTLILSVAALVTTAHRDLGGGAFAERPGPVGASRWLVSPAALMLRLTRSGVVSVLLPSAIASLVFGLFAREMANEGLDQRLALLAQLNAILACIVSARMGMTVLGEETSGRTGRVLAGLLSRSNWLVTAFLTNILVGLFSLSVTGAAGALGLMIGLEDTERFAPMYWDTMGYAPAVLLIGAIMIGLTSIRPRLGSLIWVLVVWMAIVALRADLLRLSDEMKHISPLEWLGKVPIESYHANAAIIMAGMALAGAGVSLLVFRRRDLVAG